jgi:tagatose-1,6-bisphosphate aldolase non-catalytic subunit AgaZ/GatZ
MSRLCAVLVEPGVENGKAGVNSLWTKRADVLAQKFDNYLQEVFGGSREKN